MSTSDVALTGTPTAAADAELLHPDAPHATGERRAQRREQVRERVETVLARPLREVGPDYVLPDGRVVAIYYSKIHTRGSTFLGVQNRIRNDDIVVLLLGDEADPKHLVFPQAEQLLRYKEYFTAVGGDRLTPPIRLRNGSFYLWRPSRGLSVSLDDRIDAYDELLPPSKTKRLDWTREEVILAMDFYVTCGAIAEGPIPVRQPHFAS